MEKNELLTFHRLNTSAIPIRLDIQEYRYLRNQIEVWYSIAHNPICHNTNFKSLGSTIKSRKLCMQAKILAKAHKYQKALS